MDACPGRSTEIRKGKFLFTAAEGNAGNFSSLYSAAERKIFRYERGADWAKVKRRNFGEGGRRRQRRSFSALGRGRLFVKTGRLPCRLKCGKGPRKDALFCRAARGAQSGADMKQRGSIFSGIFKTGRPWDGQIQRAEACGKAAALCGEGTAAGRRCFAAGIFCGAANEREFLRAVILIGCRRRRRADSLTLFVYFCMIRRE